MIKLHMLNLFDQMEKALRHPHNNETPRLILCDTFYTLLDLPEDKMDSGVLNEDLLHFLLWAWKDTDFRVQIISNAPHHAEKALEKAGAPNFFSPVRAKSDYDELDGIFKGMKIALLIDDRPPKMLQEKSLTYWDPNSIKVANYLRAKNYRRASPSSQDGLLEFN